MLLSEIDFVNLATGIGIIIAAIGGIIIKYLADIRQNGREAKEAALLTAQEVAEGKKLAALAVIDKQAAKAMAEKLLNEKIVGK